MALGMVVASDLADALLKHYIRGDALAQTITDKPLLAALGGKKKAFPGGKTNIVQNVQGTFMSDTAGFLQGYSEDDQLNFAQAQNILPTTYNWYEVHAGLIISFTELKKDGLSISEDMKSTEHTGREIDIITDTFENRLADYGESWARMMNSMFWRDGSQDSKQVPGIQSILSETPTVGTTGGLNRATYYWWQNRALVAGDAIAASAANQTLSKTLRNELRQLKIFGGKPTKALCGSKFLEALDLEVAEKGYYTQVGFAKGKNDIGVDVITMRGLGDFEFDPTLDQMGMAQRCYLLDLNHIIQRPMIGEENKVISPARPYQYMVFLRSMVWTGGLTCNQLNSSGIYDVVV